MYKRPAATAVLRGSRLLALPLLSLAVLSACSTLKPQAFTTDEIKSVAQTDRSKAVEGVEPLTAPLKLEEAIARAIKYNLERRARVMEEAVAAGQLEVGNFDLLPKLMANAGYRERDSDLITRSRQFGGSTFSTAPPFVSSAREASAYDLSFTWSLLDFGQSYYASKQNADRVLIAAERKRKALHLLIQDVRTAFWRAASAQRLKADVAAAIKEADDALADSRRAEIERVRNPLESLRYQRQLLENLRLLEAIDQELSTARTELAALTNLPLTGKLEVAEPADGLSTKWMDIPVEQMEEMAIAQNADLRESFYNARIASQETRRALLRILPGVSFNYAIKNSSDEYLINQTWRELGAQVSLNLFGLLSAPAQMKLAETGISLAEQRRIATQMAVLTQVHIARQQYANAWRQFERSDAIARVDEAIADHTAKREIAQTQTRLDRVANQTSSILSRLRRYQALALAHAAASKLQATLGMEPPIEGDSKQSVSELSGAIGRALAYWDEGKLEQIKLKTDAGKPITAVPGPAVPGPAVPGPAVPGPAAAAPAPSASPVSTLAPAAERS